MKVPHQTWTMSSYPGQLHLGICWKAHHCHGNQWKEQETTHHGAPTNREPQKCPYQKVTSNWSVLPKQFHAQSLSGPGLKAKHYKIIILVQSISHASLFQGFILIFSSVTTSCLSNQSPRLIGMPAQWVVTSLAKPARMAPTMKPRSKRVAIKLANDLSTPIPLLR